VLLRAATVGVSASAEPGGDEGGNSRLREGNYYSVNSRDSE
jgi:hypothetical protein